jgi:NAD(P)-dependent dehydrogenase (short-subunit alcohol dehydrogenase family)
VGAGTPNTASVVRALVARSTVVITGASTGIGFACAEQLVRDGARALLCARGSSRLEEARDRLAQLGSDTEVRAVAADVTRLEDVRRLFDAADSVGGADAVVHAAAVLGAIGPAADTEPEAWFDVVRTNLFGSFLVAREACRRMIKRGGGGAIVLFSGGGAATPFPNFTAYGCGKAGVVRLAETLALEVKAHGIRVNCVAPGFVATGMHQATLDAGSRAGAEYFERTKRELEQGGVPASVAARAVAFLVSPRAAGVTGRLLAVQWDDWERWPEHLDEISGSDLFTLRRILPRDRGRTWQ